MNRVTMWISRLLFERFGILIPPHPCDFCGRKHYRYSRVMSCWGLHMKEMTLAVMVEGVLDDE